jgi:hypothetical protein
VVVTLLVAVVVVLVVVVVGGGGCSTSRPSRFDSGKDTRHLLYMRLGESPCRSGQFREMLHAPSGKPVAPVRRELQISYFRRLL